MSRTTINIDARSIRESRKLTGLKTKREIVDTALQSLVRVETRKASSAITEAASGKVT
jgi:Arc/MetJ family transcription regulator